MYTGITVLVVYVTTSRINTSSVTVVNIVINIIITIIIIIVTIIIFIAVVVAAATVRISITIFADIFRGQAHIDGMCPECVTILKHIFEHFFANPPEASMSCII